MKYIKAFFQKIFGGLLGLKLRYQMILLYFVGGALPVILISAYLTNGTSRILVNEAKNSETTELEMMRNQIESQLSTVTMVSKYYIFDEALEHIASTEYTDYQDLVDDYRNYDAFTRYGSYYNEIIYWTSVYIENDSLRGNSHFVKVDDSVREKAWYQAALDRGGSPGWEFLPSAPGKEDSLAITRLLRTIKGEKVGVLVVHLHPERLAEIVDSRGYDTMLALNGEILAAAGKQNTLSFERIRDMLPEMDGKSYQENVVIGDEEYVMTCIDIPIQESQDSIQVISLRSYRDILQAADDQNRRSIQISILCACLSIALILAFSLAFSRRVERFHQQMQKAAAGQFDLVETLGGSDEISQLYEYLETMVYEIRRLLSEVYQEQLHAEQLKIEQKEAEYKMLASQINPHFLYNTLETIRMKARVNGQYEIEDLVKMLAKLLRKNIRSGGGDVTLATEADLIRCYLKIQQYRFGERIQYQISLEKELEAYQVFPFLLQPLVENSIIHGLEIKEGIGHIGITIVHAADQVRITVEDDGVGMEEEKLEELRRNMERKKQDSTHIGVANVHRRIRLRYGEAYGLSITSRKNVVTKIEIFLPDDAHRKDTQEGPKRQDFV